MGYTISRHCMERYAERIMDKENKMSITSFIATHTDKISDDINKMIEYGEMLYEGKSTSGDYNKNVVQVWLKDTWVLILDPAKNNVVTLFKIDLGLGEDFNKDYVSKLIFKLNTAKDTFEKTCSGINNRIQEYQDIVESNTATIAEYQKLINSLKEQNESYQTLIRESNTDKTIAETEIREIIGTLTSKKIF